MRAKNDRNIREVYGDMMDSMTRLVHNPRDAFSIIWFDIHGWLEPTDSAWKADLCEILTDKVIGENIGERVHVPARDNTPYYQMIQTRYAFGKSVGRLGEYWKELIREEHHFRLGVLLGCLDTYYKVIMPYVKSEMVDWFNKAGQGYPELSPTLKPYKGHRARIKATMQIIETASDIFTLQNMTENDYQEV